MNQIYNQDTENGVFLGGKGEQWDEEGKLKSLSYYICGQNFSPRRKTQPERISCVSDFRF